MTKMLMDENGPYDLLLNFRRAVDDRKNDGGLAMEVYMALQCKYCLSVWVGLMFALLPAAIAKPFALSAAMLFLEKHYGKG